MAKVIWSPSADEDARIIAEYIARDSPQQASLFATRLFKAADDLGLFPQMGRMIPEVGKPDFREIILRPYRLMYHIEGDHVHITGVIHGVRDWKPPTEEWQ